MPTRFDASSILQLFLESLHLFLQLPQQSILWILVDTCFVFNVLCSVCIAQRADRLIIVVVGGTQICHLATTRT